MQNNNLVTRIAAGAVAGLVATFILQKVRGWGQSMAPQAAPPMRKEPGEFMVEQAEQALPEQAQAKIPEQAERAAARSLAYGYGSTFGALYSAFRPERGNLVLDGVALGVGTWAVGYLGWLPKLGLMPPVTEQNVTQVAGPIALHVLFGIVTVAAYGTLQRQILARG